jgi:hypothetical protein
MLDLKSAQRPYSRNRKRVNFDFVFSGQDRPKEDEQVIDKVLGPQQVVAA